MRLFVGNLAFTVTEDELRKTFEPFGEVASATIPRDRFSDQPKGFAFVDMPDAEQARAAISGMGDAKIHDRTIAVAEARPPREQNSARSPKRGRDGGRGRGGRW